MLNGVRVLIVEDDVIVAMEIALEVTRYGGAVVGPVRSVAAALDILEASEVTVGVLDANLVDGEVTPVARAMIDRGLPFIVHTGIGLPPELKATHPDLPVFLKPTESTVLMKALERLV